MLILKARLGSVHLYPPLVRRAANMTNERKACNASVRLSLLGARLETPYNKKK